MAAVFLDSDPCLAATAYGRPIVICRTNSIISDLDRIQKSFLGHSKGPVSRHQLVFLLGSTATPVGARGGGAAGDVLQAQGSQSLPFISTYSR